MRDAVIAEEMVEPFTFVVAEADQKVAQGNSISLPAITRWAPPFLAAPFRALLMSFLVKPEHIHEVADCGPVRRLVGVRSGDRVRQVVTGT